jgi:TRAP transporter TatT component family protein
MISCIGVFYLLVAPQPGAAIDRVTDNGPGTSDETVLSLTDAPAVIWLQQSAHDADALYAGRENLAAAREAADIWGARLRASGAKPDFEAAWKLARATYWLGGHEDTDDAKRAALERGMEAARAAIRAQPNRPEGHFWLAANMGQLAESFGFRMGLKYRGDIRRELETVLKIDPAFQQGSADRALGRWYYKVPGLFGGSKKKSEEHLRQSLTYDPTSHASLYFLAETLHAMDRDADARAALQTLLAAPVHPGWEPEDREFKAKAQRMIAELPRQYL